MSSATIDDRDHRNQQRTWGDEAMSVEASNLKQVEFRVSVEAGGKEFADHPQPTDESTRGTRETYIPPIDIHEGPDGLILEADIPAQPSRVYTSSLKTMF